MHATRVIIAAVLTLCAFVSVLHWWNKSRPVMLVDAPSDRLRCVSYAPFRKPFQSPFDTAAISEEQIDADLKLLARRFDCVRIYSVGQGLQEVPRLASRHGLQVLLGIWIGRTAGENERELTRAVSLARRYAPSIKAIVVGNEVLLRGELPSVVLR
ncbi:MAG: glycoside hydrolase family 17, partial [bacterium]